MDEAVLDRCGLRVQTHDLISFRLHRANSGKALLDELLDQLRAGSFALDQDGGSSEQSVLLSRGPLEVGVAELLAEHVEQIEVLLPEPPSGADGIIRELGGLVRGIPALNDLLEFTIERLRIVTPEPLRAHHAATGGRGRLLVLAGEVVGSDRLPDGFERRQGFPFRMERLAGLPTIDATTEYRLDDVGFVDFGDGGEGENLPALLTYQVSDEVIFVESLHDHDDHTRGFVIQTGKQRAVEPFIDASALGFRNRFVGFQRIVDDDEIGAAAGQHAADRSREPKAASRSGELVQACPGVGQTSREQRLQPGRAHHIAAVAGELFRKALAIGNVDDRGVGTVAEPERWQGDRGEQRFEIARREIDDQAFDAAVETILQRGGDDLEMPVGTKRRATVQVREATRREGVEILPADRAIFAEGELVHEEVSLIRRSTSRMTSRSASEGCWGSDGAGRASMVCIRPRSSCSERASPLAARFTSCLTAASSLVIRLRRPFSVIEIRSPRVAATTVAILRAPLGRPRGLPDTPLRNRVATGGRP